MLKGVLASCFSCSLPHLSGLSFLVMPAGKGMSGAIDHRPENASVNSFAENCTPNLVVCTHTIFQDKFYEKYPELKFEQWRSKVGAFGVTGDAQLNPIENLRCVCVAFASSSFPVRMTVTAVNVSSVRWTHLRG